MNKSGIWNPEISMQALDKMSVQETKKPKPRFQCNVCPVSCSTSYYLVYHKNRHIQSKPFTCKSTGCDEKFFTPMERYNHMKSIHQYKPLLKTGVKRAVQPENDEILEAKSKKRKQETEIEKTRFTCDICQVSCSTRCYLIYHKNRHSGITPFACKSPGCEQKFSSPMDRYSHMKFKHKPEPPKRNGSVEEEKKPVAAVDILTCTLCQKVYPDDVAMIAHWNVDHVPTRKYSTNSAY